MALALAIELGTFQFTRPRGARHKATQTVEDTDKFQFTRPRGARQEEWELDL